MPVPHPPAFVRQALRRHVAGARFEPFVGAVLLLSAIRATHTSFLQLNGAPRGLPVSDNENNTPPDAKSADSKPASEGKPARTRAPRRSAAEVAAAKAEKA